MRAPPSPEFGFLTSRMSNFPVRSIGRRCFGKQNAFLSSAGNVADLCGGRQRHLRLSRRAAQPPNASDAARTQNGSRELVERTIHLERGVSERPGSRRREAIPPATLSRVAAVALAVSPRAMRG